MEAYEYVCHVDHACRIAGSPSDKKQEAATALVRGTIQKRDCAIPIAARASRILGPIWRHLMAQIIPVNCTAARACRPGLGVGILRVLCNGMCTAQRFHADDEGPYCRVGCPAEPDSLTHNRCPPVQHQSFISRPHNSDFFLRSLQYENLVMGIIDAFVHAHNNHRRNTDNSGNFWNCTERRIRLSTAITPTYAHAYQSLCLAGRPFDFLRQRFRLSAVKARYPNLSNTRTTTRENGNDL